MFFSKKKLMTILIFTLLVSVFAVGCSNGNDKEADKPDTEVSGNETNDGSTDKKTSNENKIYYGNGEFKALDSSKVLLTSVGQSADLSMLETMIKKTNAEYTLDGLADADMVKDYDTIVISAGASSKGLGAAGISAEDELKRAKEIIEVLESDDSKEVILAHIGGQSRRGTLSDGFIEVLLPIADYMIVVEEGNEDHMFTDYTDKNDISIALVHNISDSLVPLEELFGKK